MQSGRRCRCPRCSISHLRPPKLYTQAQPPQRLSRLLESTITSDINLTVKNRTTMSISSKFANLSMHLLELDANEYKPFPDPFVHSSKEAPLTHPSRPHNPPTPPHYRQLRPSTKRILPRPPSPRRLPPPQGREIHRTGVLLQRT